MSPSEFGFLALGLILGITAGVTLLAVVRPRSPLRPVVKVTVTPHALTPRRVAGVAELRAAHLGEMTPGSPDEDAHLDGAGAVTARSSSEVQPDASPARPDRTRVLAGPTGLPARAVAIPVLGESRPAAGPMATASPAVALAELAPARPAEHSAILALPARVDVGPGEAELAVRPRPPAAASRLALGTTVVAIPIVAGRPPSSSETEGEAGSAAVDAACAEERTAAGEACAAADVAREAARTLADRLRVAQRARSDLEARVEEAGVLADPRRLAADKDRLHAQFQTVHGAARTAEEAEAAAREWLTSVSAANAAAQDAARRVQAGTADLRNQAGTLEKLDLEASAARIGAERAEMACRASREALAACEERQRPASAEPEAEPANPLDAHWPGSGEPGLDRGSRGRDAAEAVPAILRVLRGDAAARERLVATLAAGDAPSIADWHVRIAQFVDAVTARAIEAGFIDTDEDHPFWRRFTPDEQREIVGALAALGFRFDGMRGFADGRVPAARDLSLAVGYAGLDRMRIRSWPGDDTLAALFEGAVVRADLWLATHADDLALARVESALGTRATGLDDLWNAWGRVRPAMLEER